MADPTNQTEVRIEVNIFQPMRSSSGVTFRENLFIGERDFDAIAKILGRFHDLFEEIKKQESAHGSR